MKYAILRMKDDVLRTKYAILRTKDDVLRTKDDVREGLNSKIRRSEGELG